VFRPLEGARKDLDCCLVGLWSKKRQRFIDAPLDVANLALIPAQNYRPEDRGRQAPGQHVTAASSSALG
jgi:hypothetical protein